MTSPPGARHAGGEQPCEHEPACARLDEGRLSLYTVNFWIYRDSPYKREHARLNGRTALVMAAGSAATTAGRTVSGSVTTLHNAAHL